MYCNTEVRNILVFVLNGYKITVDVAAYTLALTLSKDIIPQIELGKVQTTLHH
jgi:hypothetical protein